MNFQSSLGRFIENTSSEHMPDAASQLLELLEADEVEQLGGGDSQPAEDLAERLENRLQRLMRRDDVPDGVELIEDAVAHLRAIDGSMVKPFTFEDSDGIRWFVLADQHEDVVACYTSEPFIEAEL